MTALNGYLRKLFLSAVLIFVALPAAPIFSAQNQDDTLVAMGGGRAGGGGRGGGFHGGYRGGGFRGGYRGGFYHGFRGGYGYRGNYRNYNRSYGNFYGGYPLYWPYAGVGYYGYYNYPYNQNPYYGVDYDNGYNTNPANPSNYTYAPSFSYYESTTTPIYYTWPSYYDNSVNTNNNFPPEQQPVPNAQ